MQNPNDVHSMTNHSTQNDEMERDDAPPAQPENVEAAEEQPVSKSNRGFRFWLIFLCLALIALLSSLEGSIVSTALPTIARDVNASENYIWVVNVYFLCSAVVQPLYGRLADLWGRRWPMIVTVALFTLGSGISGGASSANMLIAGRTVQGIGGGGINVLVELILCDLLPLRERGQFMGLLFVFVTIGSAIGPFVGGSMVQHVTWRWAFYINLPFGGVSLVLLFLVLNVRHRTGGAVLDKIRKIDFLGNAILAASISSVLYALTYGGTRYSWSHPSVIITLVLGLLGHVLFVVYELSPFCGQPVMPSTLFANRTSVAGLALTFLQILLSYWGIYFLPLYFQSTLLSSPSRSGVQLLPLVITYSVGAAVGGTIVTKVGRYRFMHFIGFALIAVGMSSFTVFDSRTSTAVWVILQIIFGIGLGITTACLLPAIQAALPDRENAASTGAFAFVRSLGTIWGVSIPAAIFNNRFDQLLPTLQNPSAETSLAHGQAYQQASATFVNSFPEPLRTQIVGLYSQSLKRVWQLGIIFAGVAFLVIFVEKDLKLRTTYESDFGLEEKESKEDDRDKTAAE